MRLRKIETPYHWLEVGDSCYNYGDYTAEGGYQKSDTNRWITNLKKKPTAPDKELYWKGRAIQYWANVLREVLSIENIRDRVTLVPMPGSKPATHPDYDPRILNVLTRYANGDAGIDVRTALHQTEERQGQHVDRKRLAPDELIASGLALDRMAIAVNPLKSIVLVVDDVITMGASYKAAQQLIRPLLGVEEVHGVFLAKTDWEQPDFAALFGGLVDD
jgi:hypothetical protein